MAEAWSDVASKPEFQALPPEKQEAAREQYFSTVVAPKVPKEKLTEVRQHFDQQTKKPEADHSLLRGIKTVAESFPPTLALTGALGSSYEPVTPQGKLLKKVWGLPEQLSEAAGQKTSELATKAGAPAEVAGGVGAVTKTGALAASMLIGPKVPKTNVTAVEEAATKAKDYVERVVGLAWDSLPSRAKSTITAIANDAKDLTRLDPKAVVRQVRLEQLGIPATRGQITRDLGQLKAEETASYSSPELRNIKAEQDRVLHEKLDSLRTAKSKTKSEVGESVQSAERSKLEVLKADKRAKYETARQSGELESSVNIKPLREWLKNPTNRRNAPWLAKAIRDYAPEPSEGEFIKSLAKDAKVIQPKQATINNLEEIRKEAVANAMGPPSPTTHFAGEVIKEIDGILDSAGSNVYKEARAAHKAEKAEFDRQGAVRALTSEKSGTTDRAVALEDTFETVVLRGSNEKLKTVKESLLTGGNTETKVKGMRAWKDLQTAAIDHLKEAASGHRRIQGEQGNLQFNSSFLEALYELDGDGKLNTLFGPAVAGKIRNLAKAVHDVRTTPAGRVTGSDTAPRILQLLEKAQKAPIGDIGRGIAKKAAGLVEGGREAATVRKALTSPLEDAARMGAEQAKKLNLGATARRYATPAATIGSAAGSDDR